MNLFSKRNFIVLLASILVVAFGLMSLYLTNKKAAQRQAQVQQQLDQPPLSTSNNVEEIQNDLNNTDMQNIDKELQDMEQEINPSF
jgi:cell division protein FtsB